MQKFQNSLNNIDTHVWPGITCGRDRADKTGTTHEQRKETTQHDRNNGWIRLFKLRLGAPCRAAA